ncbi:unnamed protein product [Schistocephalus solidus]|uniref:PLAT domain-containing protein n=1 Tax=Schistocephalus solidus TaxID=70667 RepID=A0A183S7Q0_SCHSO|nr:unnamed protein product [Schistocephalus solidus]
MVWYAQGKLQPRQPHVPSPISGLLYSVVTLGSGGGGESAVAVAQGYYHLKLIHVQVTVPAQPGVEHTVDLVEIDGRNVNQKSWSGNLDDLPKAQSSTTSTSATFTEY